MSVSSRVRRREAAGLTSSPAVKSCVERGVSVGKRIFCQDLRQGRKISDKSAAFFASPGSCLVLLHRDRGNFGCGLVIVDEEVAGWKFRYVGPCFRGFGFGFGGVGGRRRDAAVAVIENLDDVAVVVVGETSEGLVAGPAVLGAFEHSSDGAKNTARESVETFAVELVALLCGFGPSLGSAFAEAILVRLAVECVGCFSDGGGVPAFGGAAFGCARFPFVRVKATVAFLYGNVAVVSTVPSRCAKFRSRTPFPLPC